MRGTLGASIAGLLAGATAHAVEPLAIEQGTVELGGSATVSVTAVESSVAFGVTLAPQVGYFVTDTIEITGSVGLSVFSFETFSATQISLAPGFQAVLGADKVRPFVGASLLFTSTASEGTSSTSAGVQVPVGVLIPLSNAVAISVGTMPSVVADLDGGPAVITIPAGALGVRSFF